MLYLETPVSVARAQVIDCPEYPSDPSLKVSDFFESCRRFKNANVANPFHSALGSDYFEAGSKEIRSTERPQAALTTIPFFFKVWTFNLKKMSYFENKLKITFFFNGTQNSKKNVQIPTKIDQNHIL